VQAIRDVILKELGDNIFLHADGRAPLLVMTKYRRIHPQPRRFQRGRRSKTKRSARDIEQRYLRAINGSPVLEIVIADKGDGIPNTLRSAYEAEHKDTGVGTTGAKITAYAFQYHSSRRSVEERIGHIKDAISDESLDCPHLQGCTV